MKLRTYIMLPEELIQLMDHVSTAYKSRSEFIEAAVRAFIAEQIRQHQDTRDLDIINARATDPDNEALDVLAYQVIP